MTLRPAAATRGQRGFSLIELMVSMAIGLVLTLAIAAVMISSEDDKRGTTAVGDINQSGTYASYILDRQIRNAGSGYAQSWTNMVGCTLYAQNGNQVVAPRPAAFSTSSAFAGWSAAGLPIALAPVVIGQGLADASGQTRGDILLVTAGTGGFTELPPSVLPGITATSLRLSNTVGFRTGDLVLVADPAVAGNRCIVEQVGTFSGGATLGGASQTLPFGGNYSHPVVGSADVTQFAKTTTAYAAQIGNYTGNLPQFSLVAVGDNSTLYSNDLLPADTATTTDLDLGMAIADGVVEMRALYGTLTYPFVAGSALTWVDPGSAGYTAAALLAGTAAAQTTLHGIVAIKLGFILRTPVGDRKPIYPAGATATLFSGVTDASHNSLARTRAIASTTAPYYRYRTVEVTIPLPNVMAAP